MYLVYLVYFLKPYKCLDIDGLLDHNKSNIHNNSEPTNNSEIKAPLYDALFTYNEHKPLWEYPKEDAVRGPKIAVEAVAVGPPNFILIAFPKLAQAGSVEVFQTGTKYLDHEKFQH